MLTAKSHGARLHVDWERLGRICRGTASYALAHVPVSSQRMMYRSNANACAMYKLDQNAIDQFHARLLSHRNAADKGVVAMMCLRAARTKSDKGMGPNRNDLPIFNNCLNAWLAGGVPTKYDLFRARHRVTKYVRQLAESEYAPLIDHEDFTLDHMVTRFRQDCPNYDGVSLVLAPADDKVAPNYGGW